MIDVYLVAWWLDEIAKPIAIIIAAGLWIWKHVNDRG